AEEVGQPGLALDLDDQRREPRSGRGAGERGRHGGFADAALPGHDDEAGCSEELRWIHGQPFGASVRNLPRGLALVAIALASVLFLVTPAQAQTTTPSTTAPAPATADDDG